MLGELAYAPPGETGDHSAELRVLIPAALAWTRAESAASGRGPARPGAGELPGEAQGARLG
jgi:hypothetical protein